MSDCKVLLFLVIMALCNNKVLASDFDQSFEEVFPADIPEFIPAIKLDQNTNKSIAPSNVNLLQKDYFFTDYKIKDTTLVNPTIIERTVVTYLNRQLSGADLIELLNKITQLYIVEGYVNSGVILEKETLATDTLVLQTVIGGISEININNSGRLNKKYFSKRLLPSPGRAVNLKNLESQLQTIKNSPLIKTINANFIPGGNLGEGVLTVNAEEEKPYITSFALSNYGSTAVGEEQLDIGFSHLNLTGFGDQINLFYRQNKDRNSYGLNYIRGVGNGDLTWDFGFVHSDSSYGLDQSNEVVLASESDTVSLDLSYLRRQGIGTSHEFSSRVEWIKTTSLINDIFPLQIIADADGLSEVLALRLGYTWSSQSLDHTYQVRSLISYGENHSDSATAYRDKKFSGARLDSQFAWRFENLSSQLNTRLIWQRINSAIFPSEIFSIGGHNSLRGYREGELAAVTGTLGSVEWRLLGAQVPVIPDNAYLGAFYDSAAINETAGFQQEGNYSSYGLSLFWEFVSNGTVKFDWAKRMAGDNASDTLQGQGIHGRIAYMF